MAIKVKFNITPTRPPDWVMVPDPEYTMDYCRNYAFLIQEATKQVKLAIAADPKPLADISYWADQIVKEVESYEDEIRSGRPNSQPPLFPEVELAEHKQGGISTPYLKPKPPQGAELNEYAETQHRRTTQNPTPPGGGQKLHQNHHPSIGRGLWCKRRKRGRFFVRFFRRDKAGRGVRSNSAPKVVRCVPSIGCDEENGGWTIRCRHSNSASWGGE